jgi:hypothetical protein
MVGEMRLAWSMSRRWIARLRKTVSVSGSRRATMVPEIDVANHISLCIVDGILNRLAGSGIQVRVDRIRRRTSGPRFVGSPRVLHGPETLLFILPIIAGTQIELYETLAQVALTRRPAR